jgi:hypothetical protein
MLWLVTNRERLFNVDWFHLTKMARFSGEVNRLFLRFNEDAGLSGNLGFFCGFLSSSQTRPHPFPL